MNSLIIAITIFSSMIGFLHSNTNDNQNTYLYSYNEEFENNITIVTYQCIVAGKGWGFRKDGIEYYKTINNQIIRVPPPPTNWEITDSKINETDCE